MEAPNGSAVAGVDSTMNGNDAQDGGFKLKFCTVCASNQNRYVSIPWFLAR